MILLLCQKPGEVTATAIPNQDLNKEVRKRLEDHGKERNLVDFQVQLRLR